MKRVFIVTLILSTAVMPLVYLVVYVSAVLTMGQSLFWIFSALETPPVWLRITMNILGFLSVAALFVLATTGTLLVMRRFTGSSR